MSRVRVVTHNVLRTLSEGTVEADIRRYKDDAQVIFFQEAWSLRQDWLGDAWNLWHPSENQKDEGAVAWRKGIGTLLGKGAPLLFSVPARTRYMPWITLKIDGKVITFLDIHPPPRAFSAAHPGVYNEAMSNIAQFYRARKNAMCMGGDWNGRNGGGIESRTNAIWKGFNIDGFAYSPDMALNNVHVIPNDVTRTDHPIVEGTLDTSDIKEDTNDVADNDDERSSMTWRVVTSNIKVSMPSPQVKQDAAWIVNNFNPDLWLTQETNNHHAELKAVKGYGFWVPPNGGIGINSKSILWKEETFQFKGGRGFKLNYDPKNTREWNDIALWMNMVHLKPRKGKNLSVYGFSMHTYTQVQRNGQPKDPNSVIQKAATTAYKRIAEIIQDYAMKDNSLVFWGGDLNINWTADGGRSHLFPNYIFGKAGMISIFDMLDQRAPSVDVVGTHKQATPRVKGKSWRLSPKSVHSDHEFGQAVFEVRGVRTDTTGGTGGTGTPTDPDEEPSPPSL